MNHELKHSYFAYGSNMCLEQMYRRCPDAIKVCNATLKNWVVKERLHADIQESKNDIVHGVLFHISDRDLKALDRYEGFPRYYIRKRLLIKTENNHSISAIAYMMTPLARHQRDSEQYSEHYRKICSDASIDNDLPENAFQQCAMSF